MIVHFGSCPWNAFFILCMHQIMGGLLGELPLLLLVLRGVWTWGQSHLLDWGDCTSIDAPKFTLVAFGGTFNFSSSMTLHHNINLFCQYFAPSGGDTTYGLVVSLPGMDTTVAGCHWLMLGAFCSHSGCWDRSSGSSLAWALCLAYSCLLRRLCQTASLL